MDSGRAVLAPRVRRAQSTRASIVVNVALGLSPRPAAQAANFTMDTVGLGPHGLLRLLSSDWDDGFKPPVDQIPVAESVLTSALGAYVLPRWGALLRSLAPARRPVQAQAARAEAFGAGLRAALLEEAWNGRWLRRAWLGPDIKWVGTSPAEAAVNG